MSRFSPCLPPRPEAVPLRGVPRGSEAAMRSANICAKRSTKASNGCEERLARTIGDVELIVLVEFLDAGGEPASAPCNANQQHGRIAGSRRRRRQHVVDSEVPVRRERNRLRVAFDEWSHVFTDERGEDFKGSRSAGGCQH